MIVILDRADRVPISPPAYYDKITLENLHAAVSADLVIFVDGPRFKVIKNRYIKTHFDNIHPLDELPSYIASALKAE
jgi:hypothetical protein